jgi:hypothetical protein
MHAATIKQQLEQMARYTLSHIKKGAPCARSAKKMPYVSTRGDTHPKERGFLQGRFKLMNLLTQTMERALYTRRWL